MALLFVAAPGDTFDGAARYRKVVSGAGEAIRWGHLFPAPQPAPIHSLRWPAPVRPKPELARGRSVRLGDHDGVVSSPRSASTGMGGFLVLGLLLKEDRGSLERGSHRPPTM